MMAASLQELINTPLEDITVVYFSKPKSPRFLGAFYL